MRGAGSLNNMLETIVQEKPIMRKSVLNPNGVVNSPGAESSNQANSTPRPRGSIDLDGMPKSKARQNSMNVATAPNNLAARPSPFAKRGLASLFGGATASSIANNSANASSSSLNLASESGVITREGSPALGVPSGGALMIGSSGGVTPNTEGGRASPATAPSPPRTPGSASFGPRTRPVTAPGQGNSSSTAVDTQKGAGGAETSIGGRLDEEQ